MRPRRVILSWLLLTMTGNTFDCVFSIPCTDFILQAKSLFQELDLSGRGTMSCLLVKTQLCLFVFLILLCHLFSSHSIVQADYMLCVAMLSQLTTTVSRTKENSSLR